MIRIIFVLGALVMMHLAFGYAQYHCDTLIEAKIGHNGKYMVYETRWTPRGCQFRFVDLWKYAPPERS